MNRILLIALWVALFGAMAGSLQHVAWSFATLSKGNLLSGYVQAIAVDIGIAALAFGIQRRKAQKRPTLWLWSGVILFCLVSTYANLVYGLENMSELLKAGALASFRPFIMSAVLPLMVIYLSEVVSADIQHAVKEAEKVAKRVERQASKKPSIDAAPDTSKEQAMAELARLLTESPDMKVSQLARAIGKSRGTVYNYADELGLSIRGDATPHTNGHHNG